MKVPVRFPDRAGDGETARFRRQCRPAAGVAGFADLSLEHGNANRTDRAAPRRDALALIAADNTHVRSASPQPWGDPDVDQLHRRHGVRRWPLTLTADCFRIDVSDRIGITSSFALTPAEVAEMVAGGFEAAETVTNYRFFTNAFGTTSQGIDIVSTWTPLALRGNTVISAVFTTPTPR